MANQRKNGSSPITPDTENSDTSNHEESSAAALVVEAKGEPCYEKRTKEVQRMRQSLYRVFIAWVVSNILFFGEWYAYAVLYNRSMIEA